MTGATVMAEDLLFATLDPTMRQISMPGIEKAILSDTVGFVSDLPTQLVAAFRATLEEVNAADLVVHVRDISHGDTEAQRSDVEDVLSEIGARGEDAAPMIEVWNKIDLLDPEQRAFHQEEAARRDDVVLMSALTGEGTEALLAACAARLTSTHRLRDIRLAASNGAAIAWVHANGRVERQSGDGDSLTLAVRMADEDYDRFRARFGKD